MSLFLKTKVSNNMWRWVDRRDYIFSNLGYLIEKFNPNNPESFNKEFHTMKP